MSSFFLSRRGAAALIGCLFVFLGLFLVSRPSGQSLGRRAGDVVGSVVSISGEAEHRLPGSLEFVPLNGGASLVSDEQVFAHETSQIVLKFTGGASVRLEPGARLVAEHDASRSSDAVLATLISGDAAVVSAGAEGSFRLVKDGRDITSTGSSPELDAAASARVVGGGARVFGGSAAFGGGGGGAVSGGAVGSANAAAEAGAAAGATVGTGAAVVASTPVETPVPIDASGGSGNGGGAGTSASSGANGSANSGAGSGAGAGAGAGDEKTPSDSLSNDEIRKQLRSAGGYFQRCYITYLNRLKSDEPKASTIVMAFTISNMGKVRDAKIVRSDFEDATLNGCVKETVERTPFRAFKGKDIPVLEFPIELK